MYVTASHVTFLCRFLSEYKKQGLNIWGLTAQNEPLDGRLPFFPFQCLGFTATQQRDFIAMDLGMLSPPACCAGIILHIALIFYIPFIC